MQIATQADAELWDIRRAAQYLGVSVAFLRKAVRLRQVPFARVGSKILRFRRSELDRWVEENPTCREAKQ